MSIAIITGGSSGIGQAAVDCFLGDGYRVVIWDISASAEQRAAYMKVDVTDRANVEGAFAEVIESLGDDVGVLVNCAGTTVRDMFVDLAWDDWAKVMELNCYGTFHCMQVVGAHMLRRSAGAVVNVASIAAERGGVGRAPYCASKAAVVALTRVAGVEWAPRGVRVNAVGPGWTQTPLFDGTTPGDSSLSSLYDLVPARRLAQPSEIAESILFLASNRASFMNGQVVYVDGGYLASFQRGLE